MDTTSISDEDASDMSDSDVVGSLGGVVEVEGDNTKDEFSRKTMETPKIEASAWKRLSFHAEGG